LSQPEAMKIHSWHLQMHFFHSYMLRSLFSSDYGKERTIRNYDIPVQGQFHVAGIKIEGHRI